MAAPRPEKRFGTIESMETVHWKIYVLKDPAGVPRYVGKTSATLRRRLKKHVEVAGREIHKNHKDNWIRMLLSAKQEPIIELLEEGLGEGWQEAEIRQIKNHQDKYGDLITNTTAGGDGGLGISHSDETKRKISEANLGRKHSLETRQKMSEARRGISTGPFSNEHRANLSIAHKGRKHTEEWKRNHAAAMQGKILGPNSWEAILDQRRARLHRKTGLSNAEIEGMPEYFTTPEMIELALGRNSGNRMKTARELRIPENMVRYYDPRRKLSMVL